jgi:hypothetical protein
MNFVRKWIHSAPPSLLFSADAVARHPTALRQEPTTSGAPSITRCGHHVLISSFFASSLLSSIAYLSRSRAPPGLGWPVSALLRRRAHQYVSRINSTFYGLSSGDFCPGGRIWLAIEPPLPDEIRLGNQRGTVSVLVWLSADWLTLWMLQLPLVNKISYF